MWSSVCTEMVSLWLSTRCQSAPLCQRAGQQVGGVPMSRYIILAVTVAYIALAAVVSGQGQTPVPGRVPSESPSALSAQRALLDKYCVTCHNQRLKTAGLALDTMDLARVADGAPVWEAGVRKLR